MEIKRDWCFSAAMREGDQEVGAGGMVDPKEYDIIPKRPPSRAQKKGAICGECGMIFEYGKAYGYCCMNNRCPTQSLVTADQN